MLFAVLRRVLWQAWDFIRAGWAWVRQTLRAVVNEIKAFVAEFFEYHDEASEAAIADSIPLPTTAPSAPREVATKTSPPLTPAPGPTAAQSPLPQTAPAVLAAPTAQPQPTEIAPASDKSDETALARMLASDDGPREVKFVRAWIAVQYQRSRKVSMFAFLTRGLGYGPRNRKGATKVNVYASTATPPGDTEREIARSILAARVAPSAAIRAHKPGQLIERGKDLTDAQILRRQADIKEGIYGRLQGTGWLLLSPDSPAIAPRKGQTASEALDAVPTVPLMDAAMSSEQVAA